MALPTNARLLKPGSAESRTLWAAMRYLMGRWYDGQADKRQAVIQRALVETAKRDGMK